MVVVAKAFEAGHQAQPEPAVKPYHDPEQPGSTFQPWNGRHGLSPTEALDEEMQSTAPTSDYVHTCRPRSERFVALD